MKSTLRLTYILLFFFSITKEASSQGSEQIVSNLYGFQGGNAFMLDASLLQYDASFSNGIDGMDARKMSNFSENIGMLRSSYVLVVERRHTIQITDTIFYKTWNMQQRGYQLEFLTANLNHPGLEGYLEDSYLKTSTPVDLNGRTTINFTVANDPLSASVTRFRIIFKTVAASALPLTFRYLHGYSDAHHIYLQWKTDNESNLDHYTVQKSGDGLHFNNLQQIKARNSAINDYTFTDNQPYTGHSYYRIAIQSTDGKISYSETQQIRNSKTGGSIKIYSNPASVNAIPIHFLDIAPGNYKVMLVNSSGQTVSLQEIRHNGGTSIYNLRANPLTAPSVYYIQVKGNDGSIRTLTILY